MKLIVAVLGVLFIILTGLLVIKYTGSNEQKKLPNTVQDYTYKTVKLSNAPAIKGRKVKVNWEEIENAEFYIVYSSPSPNGEYFELGRTVKTFFETTTGKKTAFYKVKAAIK